MRGRDRRGVSINVLIIVKVDDGGVDRWRQRRFNLLFFGLGRWFLFRVIFVLSFALRRFLAWDIDYVKSPKLRWGKTHAK